MNKTIRCGNKIINLKRPLIMGILNISYESFFINSIFDNNNIIQKIEKFINNGADLIDIGAVSSKPNAPFISEKEEAKRLFSILELVRENFPNLIISVDTYRSKIAEKSIQIGANIINDISAGELDENMFETIAKLKIPYIMMHMKGIPKTMQVNPNYKNILKEVIKYFAVKIQKLRKLGVADIIIDPGFGFGKTLNHNYEIIANLELLNIFELPILIGISRKSLIYKPLKTTPENALNGTTFLNSVTLLKNANILRVHDVKQAKELVTLYEIYKQNLHT